jgi:hypothetical protein
MYHWKQGGTFVKPKVITWSRKGPNGVMNVVFHSCDVCSPKVSLLQGREGKMEWKGTPELTEAYLLTRNCLEVRGMNRSIRQDGEPKVHCPSPLYSQRYNDTLYWHVPIGGRMPTKKKCK